MTDRMQRAQAAREETTMTTGYQRGQAAYDAAEPDDGEWVECPRCGGGGAEPWHGDGGEVWLECRRCEGEGEVRR